MPRTAYCFLNSSPQRCCTLCSIWCRPFRIGWKQTPTHPATRSCWTCCLRPRILRAAERFDSHFAAQLTVFGSELALELLCLDPAPFVDASLACGRAAALFSATFSPPGYYREVLGCPEARAVALPSPFPPENLGLYCLPISTRYRDREASIRPVSDALAAMTQGRTGNYLAFFPSYTYLRQVYEDFTLRYPQIPTLAQEAAWTMPDGRLFWPGFLPSREQCCWGLGCWAASLEKAWI